jgi:putative PIN family toxin of toxin-antitoxin system
VSRIILDTSALVAGVRSRNGASFKLLELIADKRIRPLLSVALFIEYEDVLGRPEHEAVHGFDTSEIDLFLAEFAALAEPVEVFFQWRPQTPDPGDECVLEAAVNGRADAIVTFNVRHLEGPARRFGIPVFRPGEYLMRFEP